MTESTPPAKATKAKPAPAPEVPVDPKTVTRLPETETALRTEVFQALGTASVCWLPNTGDAEFDSTRAAELGETLVSSIIELTGLGEPNLGCATTAELIEELIARSGDHSWKRRKQPVAGKDYTIFVATDALDYRTVGE